MQLVFEDTRNRWEAVTRYGEGDVPKAAQFRWDSFNKRWHSDDALAALKLRDYADAATAARLDAAIAAAKGKAAAAAEAARASVAASRATDADVVLPIAEGQAYLPYQRAGVAYALARQNTLVGDDMGLGKTMQAIGVINADESLKRVLVICPASLSRNWQREFAKFGTRGLSVGIATMKLVPTTDVVIATYDAFSRGSAAADAIHAVVWDALVLDEAHFLKNRDAARTREILGGKDCQGIRVRAGGRRLYLTGTPVPARPVEAWPLLHSLAPDAFPDFMQFARRYCDATRGRFGWDFSGASNLDELQDRLRAAVMVRRLKKDVLTELPAKRRQVIELPVDTRDAKAALAAEAEAEARLRGAFATALSSLRCGDSVAFTEMSRLRHATAVAKAPMVAKHVRDAIEASGGKVVVFAHHHDVVEILERELADLGVVSITGDTLPAARQGIVDQFQNDAATRVFIGNILAAGTGITLTAASLAVFAELDWTPGNVSQAEDRIHRIGQRNAVLIQHLVLEGSLDARMVKTLNAKQTVIDAALDAVETADDREARIAAVQTAMDDGVDDAVAVATQALAEAEALAAKRAAAAAERAERDRERGVGIAQFAADRRKSGSQRRDESIARKAATLADQAPLSEAAVEAVHQGLRMLADLDQDHATLRNGRGFSKIDSYHGAQLAARLFLSAADALVGRGLVRRYRGQLPDALVATATGEPVRTRRAVRPVVEVTAEPSLVVAVITEIQPTKRGRGRPTKASQGLQVLSQVERNRRWRASKRLQRAEASRLAA